MSQTYMLALLQEGGPLPGPKTGLLSNTQNKWELSKETHVLTKQETLLEKDAQVESSRVREPRRTAGSKSRVLWWWDYFPGYL